MAALTHTLRTRCFGRYLVDLPESFQPGYRGTSVTLYFGRDENFKTVDARVVDEDVTPERFAGAVKQRSAEISAVINYKTNGSMLLLDEQLDKNKILLRYFESSELDNYHSHEIHLLVSGVHVQLKADSHKGVMEPVETRLKALASRVHNVTDPIQAGPGFCLGPVVIDADNDYEMAEAFFRDRTPKHRDVALEIHVNTFKQPEDEPPLIARVERNAAELGYKPQVLRQGKLQLGGMPAEEWLSRREGKDQGKEQFGHGLTAESQPPTPSLAQPTLQVSLTLGGFIPMQPSAGLISYVARTPAPAKPVVVNSSLTDDEAVGLWDAIVRSIRPRHNAVK